MLKVVAGIVIAQVPDGGASAVASASPPSAAAAVTVIHGAWNDIGLVLYLSLCMVFGVSLIRAISWPKEWRERKPLACNVCLCTWLALAEVVVCSIWLRGWIIYIPAAAGIAIICLELISWLRRGVDPPDEILR